MTEQNREMVRRMTAFESCCAGIGGCMTCVVESMKVMSRETQLHLCKLLGANTQPHEEHYCDGTNPYGPWVNNLSVEDALRLTEEVIVQEAGQDAMAANAMMRAATRFREAWARGECPGPEVGGFCVSDAPAS